MTTTSRLEGLTASLGMKAPVDAVATSNIALSGSQTIDGVTTGEDYRVLAAGQTDASENGIYITTSSSWSRAADWNGPRDCVKGTRIPVASGTTYGGKVFYVTTANPISIGTTNVQFSFEDLSAFDEISPLTTIGDIVYGGSSGTGTRLAGNTTTTRKFLRQTGDGSNSAAPAWDTLTSSDMPSDVVKDADFGSNGIMVRTGAGTYDTIAITAGSNITVSGGTSGSDYTITGSSGGGSNEFADDVFRVKDNVDSGKKIAFQASNISTSTTRTFTFPNQDDTIVGATASQTLTNKTLTSPVISTISNTGTLTLPTTTTTLVGRTTTDTLTNKTLTSPTISGGTINGTTVQVGGVDVLTESSTLNDLSDVVITGAADGEVLIYSTLTGGWENDTIPTAATSLGELSDVSISGAASGDYLKYNGAEWVPSTVSGSGSGSYVDLNEITTSTITGGDALIFGLNSGDRWQLNHTNTYTDNYATALIKRTANQSGGTPGYVSSALRLDTTVANGNNNSEWGITSNTVTDGGGENVAIYGRTVRPSTATSTATIWGMVAESNQGKHGLGGSQVALEADLWCSGTTPASGRRIGVDVVVGKTHVVNQTGITTPTADIGVRVASYGDNTVEGGYTYGMAVGTPSAASALVATHAFHAETTGATAFKAVGTHSSAAVRIESGDGGSGGGGLWDTGSKGYGIFLNGTYSDAALKVTGTTSSFATKINQNGGHSSTTTGASNANSLPYEFPSTNVGLSVKAIDTTNTGNSNVQYTAQFVSDKQSGDTHAAAIGASGIATGNNTSIWGGTISGSVAPSKSGIQNLVGLEVGIRDWNAAPNGSYDSVTTFGKGVGIVVVGMGYIKHQAAIQIQGNNSNYSGGAGTVLAQFQYGINFNGSRSPTSDGRSTIVGSLIRADSNNTPTYGIDFQSCNFGTAAINIEGGTCTYGVRVTGTKTIGFESGATSTAAGSAAFRALGGSSASDSGAFVINSNSYKNGIYMGSSNFAGGYIFQHDKFKVQNDGQIVLYANNLSASSRTADGYYCKVNFTDGTSRYFRTYV